MKMRWECGLINPSQVSLIANNKRGCLDCGIQTSGSEERNLSRCVDSVCPPVINVAIDSGFVPVNARALRKMRRARAGRALRRLGWSREAQDLANEIILKQRELALLLAMHQPPQCLEDGLAPSKLDYVDSTVYAHLEMQSGIAIIPTDGQGSAVTEQEVLTFVDESAGLKVGIDRPYDGISGGDQTANTSLDAFLRRPVRIATFTWAEADAVGTTRTYAPWHLFFNDDRVKYKINNFAFIQCKLKVKVLINASPFYFGAMIGSYLPNPGLTPSTIQNDTGTRWLIPLSQRPHMWLLPQGSKGDEMTLPFFRHTNFLNIQSATDLTNMGSLSFVNYTELDSANGAAGVGVTVQVFAWAEDVKLSGPSVGLAMQGDEYGTGVVSAPASAIATGATWFENIPVIGRFATATRIGASAVSRIASLFGFTNVPNINNTEPVRCNYFPQLASTSISYPAEKLTLDPKNELTFDPSVLGLPPTDEMVISHLVQKESYLTRATWSSTNATDDILFSMRINPSMYDNDGLTQEKVYQTPMCWLSQLTKGWRGDIIVRFHFVATPYHKGRARISYDPSGYAAKNIINDAVSQTVVMTHIVDLGQETDVELRIPYQQATAFMQCRNDISASQIGWSTSLTPAFPYNNIFDNGTLTVRVATLLTAPVAVTAIPILVFVRGAENMEFGNPADLKDYSMFAPQSAEVYGDPMSMVSGVVSKVNPDRYLVNYGEALLSLRLLLRRSSLTCVEGSATSATAYYYQLKRRMARWPAHYGFDPKGTHSAVKLVGVGNAPFNYVKMTPYNWVTPAFAAQRGAMMWTFSVPSATNNDCVRLYRDTQTSADAGVTITTRDPKGTMSNFSAFYSLNCPAGAGGQAVVQSNNPVLVANLPNYTRFRFQSTAPAQITDLSADDGSDIDAYAYELNLNNASTQTAIHHLWMWSAVGTDFGLYFFVNVPTFWIYSAYPTPN